MPTSRDPAKRARQLANLRNAPPAPAGNSLALRHGAYARITDAELRGKVAAIFKALAADAPVREHDGSLPAADALPVRLLAEAMVRLERIGEFVTRRGFEDEDGKLRSVVEYELRLRAHALELARELGLTPAARAKLGLDLARAARTLDAELADGRAAWERREAEGATDATA